MREHAAHAPSAKKAAEPVAHQPTPLGGNRDFLPTAAPAAAHVQDAPPPRPAAASLTSGPLQAKKGKEAAPQPAPKPLSQKLNFTKGQQAAFDGLAPEEQENALKNVDNAEQRFEALKKGDDPEALYDFMRKATSLNFSSRNFQDGAKMGESETFKEGMVAMMADPVFQSKGYKNYMSKQLKSGLAQFTPQLEAVEGMSSKSPEKFEAMSALYGDPKAHNFLSTVLAYASNSAIISGEHKGNFNFDKKQNLTKEQWEMVHRVGVDYGSTFSGKFGPNEDYLNGTKMFHDDIRDVIAPMEENPVQNTEPSKKHRFRRWRN